MPAKVPLRRFFSWIVAFKQFDSQWSGAAFVLEFLHEMLGEWTAERREEPNRSNVYNCANPVFLPSNALQSATHCLHVIPVIILACFQDAPDLMEAARQADRGGMEHGDPGDHGDDGDGAESLRQQRASTRNALHLCLRFLQDRDLQVQARMICAAIGPLHDEHLLSLKFQTDQLSCLQWQAKQAVGDVWIETVCRIMDTLDDEHILESLRLTCGSHVGPDHGGQDHGHHGDHGDHGDDALWRQAFPTDPTFEALVEAEGAVATQFLQLVLELVSTRCWSQLHHAQFPSIFACVFHPSARIAKDTMAVAKRMFEVLCRAHALKDTAPGLRGSRGCLADIAEHEHQLVLEAFALASECGWNYKDEALRKFVFLIFAGPTNTKTNLEDMFNEIRDHERLQKNKRVARWRRWWAVMHSKKLASASVLPTLRLQPSDWQVPVLTGVAGVAGVGEGMFVCGKHKPDERLDLGRLGLPRKQATWRPSGSAGNNRAVAARILLEQDEANDFRNVSNAWLGCLLGKVGVMFKNTQSDRFYLSLGFSAWSLLAWELAPVQGGHGDHGDSRVWSLQFLEHPW